MRFGMTDEYVADAERLLNGDIDGLVRGLDPPNDQSVLVHAPGYPIYIAAVFSVFGRSTAALRTSQILFDAIAIVLIFFIALEFIPLLAAVIGALLAAMSPQISNTALVLMPDSISVLPILVSLWLFIKAVQKPSIWPMALVGALVGVSCWLRPNALLLAPLLSVLCVFLLNTSRKWLFGVILPAAALLFISPIIIRNIVVFHAFVPVSLGAAHNLSVGIADYDDEGLYGGAKLDVEAAEREAVLFGRPEYAESLYRDDGIERERWRSQQAMSFISKHPRQFARIMARRFEFLLSYERSPILSPRSTVINSVDVSSSMPSAVVSLPSDNESALLPVRPWTQNLLFIPTGYEHERSTIVVKSLDGGRAIASADIPDHLLTDGLPNSGTFLLVPFTSGSLDSVNVSVKGNNSGVGAIKLYELGPDRFWWNWIIRMPIRVLQKFFITAWMLPLAAGGFILLVLAGHWRTSILLAVVPAYYLLVHLPIHTEYRYLIANQYFACMFAGLILYAAFTVVRRTVSKKELTTETQSSPRQN